VRAAFDDQITMYQPRGGVSRYFVELVRGLRADPSLGVSVDFDWHEATNEHAVAAGLGRPARRWRREIDGLARRFAGPGPEPDLVHPTWYFPQRLPPRDGPPIVVTVHDMIPELMPEFFPGGSPHLAKDAYVRAATAIVCVSESTRRDLLAICGPLAATTHVTYHGVGSEFRPGVPPPPAVPGDYLLFVGNRGLYKDFAVALEAFAGIRSLRPEISLVAAGPRPFTPAEAAEIARLHLADAVRFLDVSDRALPGLYGHALALLYPSRYEGFGLPTLEAMASGCPAVIADSSSHPEVGGDAVLYFEPGDAAGLGSQALRILDDAALRADLIQRGIERAQAFTWQRTAAQTAAVYRGVLADAAVHRG
jgi:glycosyltransferase involved in cell wall biosynthesis